MVPDSQIAELERSPIGVTLSDIASSAEGGPKALVLKGVYVWIGIGGGPHIHRRIHDSCVGRFWKFFSQRQKKDAEIQLLLGLSRDIPLHWCHIYIDRGWVSSDEYENLITHIYTPYKTLGGNSFGRQNYGRH